MPKVKLAERWVGGGDPAYIVAEAGSNHNGSFEQALKLIDAAADARADAVKFQHFKAAKLYPRSAGASDYLNTPRSIYDIIHDMETPDDWVPELAGYCRRRGLAFLSSPFDEQSADLLDPWVPAFKVASYEMTHAPLLKHLARKGKPMIMSTGAAVLDEVLRSVDVIRAEGNDQIVVLQCTAKYPTPLDAVNARALVSLREATGLPTGLSDHSRDPVIAPVAPAISSSSRNTPPRPPKMRTSRPAACSRMRDVLKGVGGSSSLMVRARGISRATRASSAGSIA